MNKNDLKRFTKAHEHKLYTLKRFARGFAIGAGALVGIVALLLGVVFGFTFLVNYFNIPKLVVPFITMIIIAGSMVGGIYVVTNDNVKRR